jgi:hypothetical protein
MEHRRKTGLRTKASHIDLPYNSETTFDFSFLPHIEDFINYGQMVVGIMQPAGCVAVAGEGSQSVAMLRRREDQTLKQLLTLLDLAIACTMVNDIYTDELKHAARKKSHLI